jgi:hypothetical protein
MSAVGGTRRFAPDLAGLAVQHVGRRSQEFRIKRSRSCTLTEGMVGRRDVTLEPYAPQSIIPSFAIFPRPWAQKYVFIYDKTGDQHGLANALNS